MVPMIGQVVRYRQLTPAGIVDLAALVVGGDGLTPNLFVFAPDAMTAREWGMSGRYRDAVVYSAAEDIYHDWCNLDLVLGGDPPADVETYRGGRG